MMMVDSGRLAQSQTFLFLRSFDDDNKIGMKVSPTLIYTDSSVRTIALYNKIIKSRGKWSLEKELANIFDNYGLVLYISSDHGGDVAAFHSTDEKWQNDVVSLMKEASIIVCAPGATAGTLWEIGQIFEHGFESKTIFLCPGNNRTQFDGWKYGAVLDTLSDEFREWERIRQNWKLYNFPVFDPLGLFFTIRRKSQNEEEFVVNDRQSWGTSVGADLLAILTRASLMQVGVLNKLRVNIYMANRSNYFGVDSIYLRDFGFL